MRNTEPPVNTPEGHTPEGPAPAEVGKLGTPGAGKTPDVPHAADAERVKHGERPADGRTSRVSDEVAHHGAATDIDSHTTISDEDHGHAEPRVGPVDWTAWGSAAIGAAAGILVVALFYLATV